MPKDTATDDHVKDSFYDLLESKVTSKEEIEKNFMSLRKVILSYGIGEPKQNPDGKTTFRGHVWKLLLGVLHQDTKDPVEEYRRLVKLGKALKYKTRNGKTSYDAIRHDSYRTLIGAKIFDIKTQEPKVIRVLNAYVHKTEKAYNQGLNALVAPFLVCMNEMDAFYCSHRLLEEMVPTYSMSYELGRQRFYLGARAACYLADRVLHEVDPELRECLLKYKLFTGSTTPVSNFHNMYTFRHMQVLALSAQPLEEVIQLWDLFFALGLHMHVVAYVAQLILIRHKLMDEKANLNDHLNQHVWPKVNARAVTSLTTYLMPKLSDELVEDLKDHVTDRELCLRLVSEYLKV